MGAHIVGVVVVCSLEYIIRLVNFDCHLVFCIVSIFCIIIIIIITRRDHHIVAIVSIRYIVCTQSFSFVFMAVMYCELAMLLTYVIFSFLHLFLLSRPRSPQLV